MAILSSFRLRPSLRLQSLPAMRLAALLAVLLLAATAARAQLTPQEGDKLLGLKPGTVNRLGYKTYRPILEIRRPAQSQIDFDPETGAVVETIVLPALDEQLVLQVHYWSVYDYLERKARERQEQELGEMSRQYLMGEQQLARTAGQQGGMMPEINLPDFMPKSLASIIGEGTGSLTIHGRSTTELSGTTTFQKPEDNSAVPPAQQVPAPETGTAPADQYRGHDRHQDPCLRRLQHPERVREPQPDRGALCGRGGRDPPEPGAGRCQPEPAAEHAGGGQYPPRQFRHPGQDPAGGADHHLHRLQGRGRVHEKRYQDPDQRRGRGHRLAPLLGCQLQPQPAFPDCPAHAAGRQAPAGAGARRHAADR